MSAGRLFSRLFAGTRRPRSVTLGTWTKIGEGVILGERVRFGDWSQVGDRSRIGPDCAFGPWAQVGADVTLGARVRLGSHTRVQDGVTVPDDAVFGDRDLVTPDGVIPDRCGGYSTTILRGGAYVAGPFGKFLVPLEESDPDELTDQMVDEHQWGRSDALEPCRCLRAPHPGEEEAGFRAIRARQKLYRLGLWPVRPPIGGSDPAQDPDPGPEPGLRGGPAPRANGPALSPGSAPHATDPIGQARRRVKVHSRRTARNLADGSRGGGEGANPRILGEGRR